MGRSRHGIIGPDDPTISYFNGIYSIFHRFIKEHVDSLQPDKQNRYVYCYNNPINLIDPLGLSPDEELTGKLKEEADKKKTGEQIVSADKTGDNDNENKGKNSNEVKSGLLPTLQRIGESIGGAVGEFFSSLWESISEPRTEEGKIAELQKINDDPNTTLRFWNPNLEPSDSLIGPDYVSPYAEYMRIEQSPATITKVADGIDAGLTGIAEGPEELPGIASLGGVIKGLSVGLDSRLGHYTTIVDYNKKSKEWPWSDPAIYRFHTFTWERIESTRSDGAMIVNWRQQFLDKKEAYERLNLKE